MLLKDSSQEIVVKNKAVNVVQLIQKVDVVLFKSDLPSAFFSLSGTSGASMKISLSCHFGV